MAKKRSREHTIPGTVLEQQSIEVFQNKLNFHTAWHFSMFEVNQHLEINEICDFFGLTHFNWNYLAKKITERSVNLSRVNFKKSVWPNRVENNLLQANPNYSIRPS